MNRDALRPILVAVVCVLALSVAAATLTSPVDTEGNGGGGFSSPSTDPSEESGIGGEEESGAPSSGGFDFPRMCLSVLSGDAPFGVLAATLLLLGAVAYSRYDGLVAFSFVLGLGIPLFLLVTLLTAGCAEPFSLSGSTNGSIISLGDGASSPVGLGDGEGRVDPTSPSTLLFVLLALTPLALVGLYLFSDVQGETDEDETLDRTDEERRSAIGRAAGRAADRIEESVDVENEVYRAWREMTGHLDVDRPESSTPGEFADAAVDAGMSADDVEELTGLFEEVRYGGMDPTDDREERAVDALRRIETTYAGDEQ
ncbi:DUF4129 domain-containing protein [Halostella sp. JP-L12]|uniref:DUF4129 domain-containing protein n=1 Tax=Halostella TaxID=1843185 RepID=UPI000EF79BE6|nr:MULTISPECIES: DUF4129 domain-containing protein [Halostella]NHN47773.1 DUF4129 domain-containing protein [Halostella sp. JP-L12]